MKDLQTLREQLARADMEFSRHALRRIVERNIGVLEIQEAGIAAEFLEIYPDDKYSPSALMLGFSASGRPLHFQVSLIETDTTKIITVCEPDKLEWIGFRTRR